MKIIKYIENTVWVRKGAGMYACEYEIDGNDERDSDISVDELSKLDWISWEEATKWAKFLGLKKFTLEEIDMLTIDDDVEILRREVIGWHHPSHLVRVNDGNNTYVWKPIVEVVREIILQGGEKNDKN